MRLVLGSMELKSRVEHIRVRVFYKAYVEL